MSITGNLRTLEFAELLQWLAQGQKTGALVIQHGSSEKRIYFREGRIISSQSNNPEEHLGTFMVREGLLDEETLARAVKLQESTQILLGKVLVTLGTISEEELNRILQRKTEESLYELFNWTEGEFHFLPDDLPKLPMVPIEIDVTNIVLEGAKRFDEARRDGKLDSGDYGQEIDEMLSSDIFQGVEADTEVAEPTRVDTSAEIPIPSVAPAVEPAAPSDDEREPEEPSDVRGYYSGASKRSRVRSVLAAAAAVALIAIGITVYFLMRSDPARGTADRASLERSMPPATRVVPANPVRPPEPNPYLDDLLVPDDTDRGVEAAAKPSESAQLQARYEAELAALKQQLQQAQVAAAERDDAMEKIAQLEQQVARAEQADSLPQALDRPQARFEIAQLGSPIGDGAISAGGDEAPPLGSPLPTTEADQEAGTDFATEMVEPSPGPLFPELSEASSPAIEAPVEETVEPPAEEPPAEEPVAAAQPEAQITSPVLLSRPKPRYPVAAMRLRKEAEVTLRLLIDATGKVVEVERVGRDPGMGFSRAAIDAARETRWQPATSDGEPIEMWAEMKIAFKL